MTTIPPVEVKAMWDGTDLVTGTQQAEQSVEDLAREVDYAADSMRRSLQSIDDGVSSTLGSSGSINSTFDDFESHGTNRMGEAGAEVASEFGSNLAEGIASGDTSATVLDSLTGLGATVAASGGLLAFAGIGALVGGALVSGVVNRIKQADQAITDAINSSFQAIEVKARQSNKVIMQAYQDTLTFKDTITAVGGGDAQAGFEKLADYAGRFGFEVEDAVNLINREMTPGAKGLRDAMAEVSTNIDDYVTRLHDGDVVLDNVVTGASALNRLIDEQRQKQQGTLDILKAERDATADIKNNVERSTGPAADFADSMKRAEEATWRIGANLGNAIRQAGLLGLALDGIDD